MAHTLGTLKATDLQKLGVSKPYAHQLLAGGRTPSLRLALLIEAQFGISPRDWIDASTVDHPAPSADAAASAAVSDAPNLNVPISEGAENPGENVSRTGVAA